MESITLYGSFWLIYMAFALLGLWCWSQVFFWLPQRNIIWNIWLMLGAVILYTPSPISADSWHFAPAVFVLILDALSNLPVKDSPAIIWLSAGFCIGVLCLLAIYLFGRNKPSQQDAIG